MNSKMTHYSLSHALILAVSLLASSAIFAERGGFHGGGGGWNNHHAGGGGWDNHNGGGGYYNHGGGGYYNHGAGYYNHGGYYNNGGTGGVIIGPTYPYSCPLVQQCFPNGNCIQTQQCN